NCLTRSISTVSPQSLLLMNNRHVRDLAGAFADRVESIHADDSPDDMQSRVETAYQLALSRPPSDVERKLGVESLTALRAAWRDKPRAAMETYCHTILNSAAFLYID
ncbi:MAG: DUF1553 domain-containing protein, partial [Pirellulaceae bacterium]|nr:DUF1553 domain-containing protein [Pirellulaceae bacterium]